jgi:hypothetical protein
MTTLLSSAGKFPPEFEQLIAPVKGDLVVTMYRAPVGAAVPVKGPVDMITLLAGEMGSHPGSTSFDK